METSLFGFSLNLIYVNGILQVYVVMLIQDGNNTIVGLNKCSKVSCKSKLTSQVQQTVLLLERRKSKLIISIQTASFHHSLYEFQEHATISKICSHKSHGYSRHQPYPKNQLADVEALPQVAECRFWSPFYDHTGTGLDLLIRSNPAKIHEVFLKVRY